MFDFEGKNVVVTGAAGGIGLATAEAFLQAGANVMLTDVSVELLMQQFQRLEACYGARAAARPCDVSDRRQVRELFASARELFGPIDVGFNNAGIQTPQIPAGEQSEEDFERTLAVNLKGIWYCMCEELADMTRLARGAIINTSSQGGVTGFPGQAAYIASKHAVIGLTRTAALDYARRGIRINAVCPGVILTPMCERLIKPNPALKSALEKEIPMGRLGEPQEIASTVLWLASQAASFVTGQAIIVDGGYTVK